MTALLRLEGVSAGYGAGLAIQDVSLHVAPGEAVGLLGPNGAGKTTTLRAASGLIRLAAGAIYFDGRRIDELPAERRTRLGLVQVPEGRQIFGELTVEENLAIGAYSRPDRQRVRADVEAIMEHFPILGRRRRQAAALLSGGEQQILAIARALVARPRLLMLDEPSLGLDPLRVQQVFALLGELRAEGLTLLVVEQSVSHVAEVVERAYVMEAGRIRAEVGRAELAVQSARLTETYLGGAVAPGSG